MFIILGSDEMDDDLPIFLKLFWIQVLLVPSIPHRILLQEICVESLVASFSLSSGFLHDHFGCAP